MESRLRDCAWCKKPFETLKWPHRPPSHRYTKAVTCCWDCTAHYGVANRSSRRKLSARKLAYSRLNNAIEKGHIVRPSICSRCGDEPAPDALGRSRIEGHHEDHSKPLEVEWLCDSCHKEITPSARGERSTFSKFKPKDVRQIRYLLQRGLGVKEIGRLFHVTHKAIADVRDGKSWGWLI